MQLARRNINWILYGMSNRLPSLQWTLMSEQVLKALAQPESEGQTVADIAVSAGIGLGRRLRREGRFVCGREKG